MKTIVTQVRTRLARLLEAVERGEEIVIAKTGKLVARLVPYKRRTKRRKSGALKGRIWIADDFDAPLPEPLAGAFRGELA